MSVTVYYLQHRIERGSEADEKAIGFYATPDAAAAAVERLRGLPQHQGSRRTRLPFRLPRCRARCDAEDSKR